MIAIHYNEDSFCNYWIEYCKNNDISFKLVNCYCNNIIEELYECDSLMWHHHHGNYRDRLIAKQILYTIEQSGKKVFPNFRTNWHFDDKIGQKYLLESLGAPFVKSYIFTDKIEAIYWANNAKYPIVFKLRSGAGSSNVVLVKSKNHALKIIRRAFKNGFRFYNKYRLLNDRFLKYLSGNGSFIHLLKGLMRIFIPVKYLNLINNEKGYVYFQDFIPNNNSDIRVIVIDKKAFAIKRLVRKNDFRASGSGLIIYNKNEINIKCIQISFDITKKMNAQCLAFDFIFEDEVPLIVEISYGFMPEGYTKCPGYWDEDLIWHEGKFNPYGWMVELIR